jgi:hypothetical protein
VRGAKSFLILHDVTLRLQMFHVCMKRGQLVSPLGHAELPLMVGLSSDCRQDAGEGLGKFICHSRLIVFPFEKSQGTSIRQNPEGKP